MIDEYAQESVKGMALSSEASANLQTTKKAIYVSTGVVTEFEALKMVDGLHALLLGDYVYPGTRRRKVYYNDGLSFDVVGLILHLLDLPVPGPTSTWNSVSFRQLMEWDVMRDALKSRAMAFDDRAIDVFETVRVMEHDKRSLGEITATLKTNYGLREDAVFRF